VPIVPTALKNPSSLASPEIVASPVVTVRTARTLGEAVARAAETDDREHHDHKQSFHLIHVRSLLFPLP